ncbi:ParB/RepB/Spo0J family partition protein [Agrococcus jenensis]|uniref:ParB family chromosome partitioning protein n=1 Tax=Agrococcus jenensis TaxID=46353 RepID=A0A3N2ARI1_9MICO|nr:ParB/RepB/Spo0J family partition protein [Agrococcus jenensis]ROR65614.1 ParB family chromosome partitioning protein [Agrococcus jenensis]
MSKRAGLGRGIGALIPTGPAPAAEIDERDDAAPTASEMTPAHRRARRAPRPGGRPVDVFFSGEEDEAQGLLAIPGATFGAVAPGDIRPNANQPRTVFDEDDLAELEHSIREFGVLQPIVVRPVSVGDDGTHYELIMGERRWRASQRAGLETIPAVIKDTPDDAMLRDALLENLHRASLNPLEEASAYQQLMDDFSITQDELSKRIGRSRPQISNTIRLLKLPESIQAKVAGGVLSAGHARAILSLPTVEAMEQLAAKIVNEDLSVRAAEAAAGLFQARSPRRTPTKGAVQHGLDEIATRLEDRLDTRVRIALGRSKGQLTIDFATVGDLNRILSELGEQGVGAGLEPSDD